MERYLGIKYGNKIKKSYLTMLCSNFELLFKKNLIYNPF